MVDVIVQVSRQDNHPDAQGKETKPGVQVTHAEDVVYVVFLPLYDTASFSVC